MDEFTETLEALSYRPAVVATAAWVGIGIGLDVWLIRTRKSRLISEVFRTLPGASFLLVFCLHVAGKLGKLDPFHYTVQKFNSCDRLVTRLHPVTQLSGNTPN